MSGKGLEEVRKFIFKTV